MEELQAKPLRKWEFYSRKETCERALSDIMLVELIEGQYRSKPGK